MNARNARDILNVVVVGLFVVSGCSDGKAAAPKQQSVKAAELSLTAEAPSSHYVTLTFGQPVGPAGALPSSYIIRDGSGSLLPISSAQVSPSGTQVTLATATQQPTDYQLFLAQDLGIGSAGFVGSSQREPFLESALSLSDTSLQLTFSERMDRQLAETKGFYRLVDPDTDMDVDIEITAAMLEDDLRTVVLTTTPQLNRLYAVQATNVKSRFICDDGDQSNLTQQGSAATCSPALRPLTAKGAEARLVLTARTSVANQPTNPDATGTVGTVKAAGAGVGVGTATCSGNPCASSNGGSAQEELTVDFDVPTRADTVVLGLQGFGNADLVLFVSSAAQPGFDYTISAATLKTIAVGGGTSLYLDQLSALPKNLMIDRVRVRATSGASCVSSVCVQDGRTVDPTRNVANFWGIPTVDTTAPRLVSAISTSPTTVLATFSEPLDSEAADPTSFSVGPDLSVTAAAQTEYQTQVLLTTTTQSAGTSYTLTVANLRDRARNLVDPSARTATFLGISTELFLETANALSSTQVQLTFSEPMSRASLENIANYSLTDPDGAKDIDVDIRILSAVASADLRSVVLTTTPQQNILYQVVATNIRGMSGDFLIDPSRNTAIFQGIPGPDSVPPRVLSAVSASDHTVLITFSEALRVESANAVNFNISPALAVLDAALTAREDQILITTAAQMADMPYTITVSNVQDKAGNTIVAGSGNVTSFTFAGAPETADGAAAPRVVGAASTSNSTVVVTFSKAMSNDALLASAYAIVQDNVNPEVGTVSVLSVRFIGDDHTAVELTTRPQNEVTYSVYVTNVRDRAGNQLAAKETSAGVLVDPRRAVFAGSPWSCGPRQCNNGSTGLGSGYCGSDDDCTADGKCDPVDANCVGTCQTMCSTPDPDGDSLPDYDEQRGTVITITRVDGTTIQRQVTSNPDVDDTDGDGLTDGQERLIGSDPRDADTDDDSLSDYDEYNVTYTDTNSQDTDGDSLDDMLEVEFYKTNALIADSDGDGFADDDELFSIHRDPRIADLPSHAMTVGSVRLALDQRFTYVDAQGNTHSETQSTSSSLENDVSNGTSNLNQTVGHWLLGADIGIDSCQTDNACVKEITSISDWATTIPDRLHAGISIEGGQEFTTANTIDSARATTQAYAQGLERGAELSQDHEVTREVVGASLRVDITFTNTSDVAINLRNLEIRASTPDSDNPMRLVPIATLVPERALIAGEDVELNIGPGQSRGPMIFESRDVFPAVVDELMRSPRGIVFNIANFDLVTGDERNFATGLQSIRERTVGIRIDKGDGQAEQLHVITAGVLDRPLDDLRCTETGSKPGQLCSNDADCGDSAPCEGGKIVGGFSAFAGTGGETPLPLEFVLRDTLGMRKARPAQIVAGGTVAGSTAAGDDVQVVAAGASVARGAVIVAPGRNGVLDTVPAGSDYSSEGFRVLAGANGAADSAAQGDDIQVIAAGTFPLAPSAVVIAAGPNGRIDTAIAGDDQPIGPDGIRAGSDAAVQSVARGDDVQVVPVGTTGVAEDAVVISAGANGVLDTAANAADKLDIVSGYEVSRTCSGDTPFRILAGRDGQADTLAEDGVCVVAYAPHYPREQCTSDAGCGSDASTGQLGSCRSDHQAQAVGTTGLSPDAVVVEPDDVLHPGAFFFLESVPVDDDVYVGPGIPCTVDADCTVGTAQGTCDGPEQLVRVEERRRGQFRREWAMLMSDGTQLRTDFSALAVRPGDEITLAFVQDIDRDGLLAQEEFVYSSSDFRKDTDDDGLGDFSEVRVGWDVGVVGEPLRHVLPDPRRADSDGDGLSDLEEQDLRIERCACNAVGPKSLLGSGNLLRGASGTESGRPCTDDAQCGGALGSCRDVVSCPAGGPCAACPSDVTLYRSDARLADSDRDALSDAAEVFGYLTGAGVVDPAGTDSTKRLVLAGPDLKADTKACPGNYCIEQATVAAALRKQCSNDGDCASRICVHPTACDDVQVLPVGTGVRDPRTVVAIIEVGSPTVVPSSDVLASSSAPVAVAQSTLGGDDLLVVGNGQSVLDAASPTQCEDGGSFAFCSAIKPGVDGVLASVVGGDDALVPGGRGQRSETSDPLNADTDQDLVSDGFERTLGSSPNRPGDAAFGGDIDEDGLTDSMERAGWEVRVYIDGSLVTRPTQTSNPLLPDSDFDGLPDYAERYMPCASHGAVSTAFCPTNPNAADSDGDGISDLDELSAAQLELLATYSQYFPGYTLDTSRSKALGTDPSNTDADGDGLRDYAELFDGWLVLRADGTTSHVYSDPSSADTDSDGLLDGLEKQAGTDPRDPDTDGDGRTDGQEAAVGSNALRPDLSVTVTYANIDIVPPQSGEGDDNYEWKWGFFVQEPGGDFPGTLVSDQFDCPRYDSCLCFTYTPDRRLPINKSISLDMAPGEAIVLNGMMRETHDNRSLSCPNGDVSVFASANNGDRIMQFTDQPITYEQLQSGQLTSRSINMVGSGDTGTAATVLAEVSVNCAGSGRGICRTGSLCVSNSDCETKHCDVDPADATRHRCIDYCGNGIRDAGEACDDGNELACGSCGRDCTSAGSGQGCAGGATCVVNADCASGTCFHAAGQPGRCTSACGDGWVEGSEVCDDGNTLACGSCNADCTLLQLAGSGCGTGTRCATNADCASNTCTANVCVTACGNGIVEAGEVCDDGNTLACGRCSASCSAVNSPVSGCPIDISCAANADCASASCVGGVCH